MAEVTYKFSGMNDVDDPADVGAPVPNIRKLVFTEGVEITNADPDDEGGLSRRPGQTSRHSGNVLTMWANDEIILFHEGALLRRLRPDTFAVTTLKIGLSTLQPAVFCDVNGVVVYTDGALISRIYQGRDYPMPVPTEQFKLATPAGQVLTLFYRRLLVGSGDVLYVTDPDTVEQMDSRLCQFPLGGRIKMIAPVDDGVFVGAGETIYYLNGRGPQEWSQPGAVRRVASYAAIPGTDVTLKAELTGMEKVAGNITEFTTTRGIRYGLNGGLLVEASEKIQPPAGKSGCAVLREQHGATHYLVVLRDTDTNPFNASDSNLQTFI